MIKNIFFGILFLICFLSSCKTNREVTPYEYALLSAHVYNDGTKDLPEKFETFVVYEEKEKSLLGHLGSFINGLDVDKVIELNEEEEKEGLIGYLAMKAITTGGYYGQAYLDRTTNEVIIAHRGTENLIEAFSEGQDGSQKVGTKIWNLVKDLDDDYEIYAGKIPKQQFLEAQIFTKKVKNTYQKEFNERTQNSAYRTFTGSSIGRALRRN